MTYTSSSHTSARRAVRRLLACCLLLPLGIACVQPSVRSIIGPSGQPTLFVSCAESGECYELAGKYCPSGYNIQRARGATPESYLVSCRQAPVAQAYYPLPHATPAAAPRPAPAAAALGTPAEPVRDGSWPPGTESVDPPHPWPQHAPPPPPPPPPPPAPADSSRDVASGLSFPRPIGTEDLDVGY